MTHILHNRRGAALGIVILIALVCGLASYFTLFTATSEARHSRFFHERAVARHAAEAGLVIAMQRLWGDPGYCGVGGTGVETFNIPVGAALIPVTVNISDCTPGNRKQLSAQVDYWASR